MQYYEPGYNILLWKTEHPMKCWTRGLKYYCCKILTPTPSDFSIPNKEGVHDFTAFLFLHDNYSFLNLILLPFPIGPHDAFVIGLAAITSQVRFKVSPSSMMEFPKITSSGATEKCTFFYLVTLLWIKVFWSEYSDWVRIVCCKTFCFFMVKLI